MGDRQGHGGIKDGNVKETIAAIEESLKECEICLKLIEQELDPLDVIGTDDRPAKFTKRIKFVCSQSFIKAQQSLIDTHLANLKLDFDILQTLDQAATHKALKNLIRALVRSASGQQRNLSDLELPESDADPPSAGDEPPDEAELEPEPSKQCPVCQRLNALIPDTPLAIAVKHRESDSILPLIAEGYDVTATDANEWTLLHHSTHLLDESTTYRLLEATSSPQFLNAQTKDGHTALMHVASQADADGSYEIASELLCKQCNVKIEDFSEDKRTALWWAVDGSHSKNRERMVDLLINSGATVTAVRDGKLQEQARTYPRIEQAAKLESGTEQPAATSGRRRSSAASKDGKDSIGRRLTKVFTHDAG